MDLKSMLLPEKAVDFDFPGCKGLTFKLAYLSKESNQALFKRCQDTRIDPRTRQPIEKFNDEKFVELYAKEVIRGWSGFKLKFLKELVLLDVPEGQEEEELEYSEENALDLLKNSVIFDNWITDVLGDLSNFTTPNNSKPKLND